MHLPNPRWLKTLAATERAAALDEFRWRLAQLYANPEASEITRNQQISRARAKILSTDLSDGLWLPSWLPRGPSVSRTRFLMKAAALLASPQGSFNALSRACNLHDHSIATMSRRPTIPARTAKAISKLVGADVLPLALLNPVVFGDG